MKNTTIQILSILLIISCDRQNLNHAESKIKKDTLKNTAILKADKTTGEFNIEKTLAVLKEKNLQQDSINKVEIRFHFFQPKFKGFYEFYKINFTDSSLLFKKFTEIFPDGSGNDSIYLTKTIKLTKQNLKTIMTLQDKSMFWNLKTLIESDRYPFDSDTYIYESVRVENSNNHNHYHLVYSYAPTNKDFINFGQYFRLLAGQKTVIKSKELHYQNFQKPMRFDN